MTKAIISAVISESEGPDVVALKGAIESWLDHHWVDPIENLVEEAEENFPSLSRETIRAAVHTKIERYQNALKASNSSRHLVAKQAP